ncbi:diaminopimelate epimerase [Bdellovibrionota bacterium FG-2]
MKNFAFLKMQGLGNDFVLFNSLNAGAPGFCADQELARVWGSAFARKISDRRFGVGADQLLWLRPPQGGTAANAANAANAKMDILNADGSVAEMCGNGIRAAGLFLARYCGAQALGFSIETLDGVKHLTCVGTEGKLEIRVDMGVPAVDLAAGLAGAPKGAPFAVQGQNYSLYKVGMGVPHAVFFTNDVRAVVLETVGPAIENHSEFPGKTNVDFVQVVSRSEVLMRVWERGAGITLACGTGACAAAVAAIASARVDSPTRVVLPGGALTIEWFGPGASVFMTGPACEVFRGELSL